MGPDMPLSMLSISNGKSKHQADIPLKIGQIRVLETPVTKRPLNLKSSFFIRNFWLNEVEITF
jgi:hypothetical protein